MRLLCSIFLSLCKPLSKISLEALEWYIRMSCLSLDDTLGMCTFCLKWKYCVTIHSFLFNSNLKLTRCGLAMEILREIGSSMAF